MQSEAKFASLSASIRQSQQQRTFPYNLSVEEYDTFALFNPSQSEDFVILPVHFYELFKGIALDRINLQSKHHIQDKDLTVEVWLDCNTFFFTQFPEFIFRPQTGFSERSEILQRLRPANLRARHEKLIAEYKDTYTKDRLQLEEIAMKLKDGTLSLEKLSLKQGSKPAGQSPNLPAQPAA